MEKAIILLFGMLLEIIFDWPKFFYDKLRHPIIWIGVLISKIEKKFNKESFNFIFRRLLGFLTVIICLTIILSIVFIIIMILEKLFYVEIFYIFVVWSFICSRSLFSHIEQISFDLKKSNLSHARFSLSKVVGRDTSKLKRKAIIRASLESLSESTSDGVIGPIFWYCVFGVPGLIIFKTINTMDSMIGYKSQKYLAFGYASAKLDDIINFIPSRLTGLIFVILSSKPYNTFKIMLSNASKLSSPNSGWPESAFAGALNIRLGGPKSYSNIIQKDKWLNDECNDPDYEKLKEGLKLYKKTLLLIISIIVFIIIYQFFKFL